jgi:hypothetical protein
MGAGGIEDRGMGLGQCTNAGFVPKPGADRHHSSHARPSGTRQHIPKLGFKLGKVEMAMAVRDAGKVHGPA